METRHIQVRNVPENLLELMRQIAIREGADSTDSGSIRFCATQYVKEDQSRKIERAESAEPATATAAGGAA